MIEDEENQDKLDYCNVDSSRYRNSTDMSIFLSLCSDLYILTKEKEKQTRVNEQDNSKRKYLNKQF